MKRLVFISLLLTPCLANSKAAFSPRLQAQLDSVPLQAVVEAFLVVNSRVPVGLLKASLPDAGRQRLHAEVVSALKEKAAVTQAALLDFLAREKTAGEVLEYNSYWIDNYVYVRATKAALLRLAERADLAEIYENPQLVLIAPLESPAPAAAAAVPNKAETNLIGIGCRQLWKRGLTGKGRLVCNLDTGVDGNHRAFKSRWRGRRAGVSKEAAWFDPVWNLPFPHTYPSNQHHGTHVMGIMCGLDSVTNDTIGVAPEAEWISAAVIDNGANGGLMLDALQWAADPDGNPNTVEDVPDAVNNSWAYPTAGAGNNLSCNPFFWPAIDNLEAAGAVAVFAAGNAGPINRSIGNPADRGTSLLSSFAVGNFDLDSVRTDPANPDSVVVLFGGMHKSSSIGPTECGPDSLKPEVSAPGTAIFSAFAFNQFGFLTGTSMAAPHVAGAVALLRQYNPNASADTIKWALLNSATDLFIPGPDTVSGYGLINLPKALALLPPNEGIHLYVKRDSLVDAAGRSSYAGGTFELFLTLSNNGVDTARALSGKLASADAKSQVLSDSASFGELAPGGAASNAGQPFRFALVPGLVPGERFRMDLKLAGSNGFFQTLNLAFTVGEKPTKSIYNHQNGNVLFTVSNYGAFGFEPGGLETRSLPGFLPGEGFERKSEPKVSRLFEASFLAGVNDSMVSNTASNEFCCFLQAPDADFAVHPGGNLKALEPGPSGGAETFSIFDDRLAKYPLGLVVSQRSFTFDSAGLENVALLEFTLKNAGGAALTNLRAGLFFDFNFHSPFNGNFLGDKVNFDRAGDLGYQFNEEVPAYRAIASADTGRLSGFRAVRIFPVPSDTIGVVDGFTLREKWACLASGLTDTALITAVDAAMLASKGPFFLPPGDSLKIAFALVAAPGLDSLKIYGANARNFYLRMTSRKGDLNADGFFTSSDVVLGLNCIFLFTGCPLGRIDMNCDGMATMSDGVFLLNRVFLGALPPCP